MPDFYFKRTIAGLAPGDDEAKEALKRFELGGWVKVKGLVKPRNPRHHAKFFALLNKVLENTEYDTTDQLLTVVKIRMGYVEWVPCPGVEHPVPIPKSIAFDSMDQLVFETFYDDAVNCILQHFLPQTSEAELDDAIREVAGF